MAGQGRRPACTGEAKSGAGKYSLYVESDRPGSFVLQVFTEHLLCARPVLGASKDRKKPHPQGAGSLAAGTREGRGRRTMHRALPESRGWKSTGSWRSDCRRRRRKGRLGLTTTVQRTERALCLGCPCPLKGEGGAKSACVVRATARVRRVQMGPGGRYAPA